MELEIRDIHKSFGETEVLHGISFKVESGQALGLLGRNGAGKTTAIRILMDVFHANSGQILIDGRPFHAARHKIGYLPEERGLYPKRTVTDQMVFLARLRGMKKPDSLKSAAKWLERLGISEYAGRKLETLSKGNQQKVQLAATLIADPEIVILDEPFSGLDPVNSQVLKDVVNELIEIGKIVIFSSHQMNYVEEFCDSIAIIHHGQIVLFGKLSEIKRQYGQNRLMLSSSNYGAAELKSKLQAEFSDILTVSGMTKTALILNKVQDAGTNDIMRRIADSDIEIYKFGSYEPSLGDIFVDKAGDEE